MGFCRPTFPQRRQAARAGRHLDDTCDEHGMTTADRRLIDLRHSPSQYGVLCLRKNKKLVPSPSSAVWAFARLNGLMARVPSSRRICKSFKRRIRPGNGHQILRYLHPLSEDCSRRPNQVLLTEVKTSPFSYPCSGLLKCGILALANPARFT